MKRLNYDLTFPGLSCIVCQCSECGGKIYFYVYIGERGEQLVSRFCKSCKEENFAFIQKGKFSFSGALPF